jgi:hypothetical protein
LKKIAKELGVPGITHFALEIIPFLYAKLYGARSRKNQKVLEALQEIAATL